MSFSTYLRHKLNEEGLSSRSLIAKLQLFNSLFSKLDSVTLSRWVNGRTIPTIEKQLMVIKCFESKLYPCFNNINSPSVPRTFIKTFEEVFDSIESSYHSILNYPKTLDSDAELFLDKVSWSRLNALVPHFYESTASYSRLFSEFETGSETAGSDGVHFCSIRSGSRLISHLSFSRDVKFLRYIFGGYVNIDFNKEALFFNFGHYTSRKHYQLLVGTLLNKICEDYANVEDVYVISRGVDFLNFVKVLGGELICANRESNIVGNIYLLRINLLSFLSSPFLFDLMKESYNVYDNLKE